MSTNNDGWILIAQRKPVQADLPVWMWGKEVGDADPRLYKIILPFLSDTRYTHWKPAAGDIPAPPKELTQKAKDEIEWEGWYECATLPTTSEAWHAALAYERAEVGKMLPPVRPLVSYGTGIIETERAIEAIRARCGGGK